MKAPIWQLWFLAGVMGLIVGSFLNVVVSRVPAKQSVIRPASACPNCHHSLGTLELIPVVSWLWLRAKCKECGIHISARYPLTEAGTAAVWVLVAVRFGPNFLTVAWCILAAALIALIQIDFATLKLPAVIVWGAGIPAMAIATVVIIASQDYGRLLGALIATAIPTVFFALFWYFSKGMGFGDVRLVLVLSWMLGLLSPLSVAGAIALSMAVGAVYGIIYAIYTGKGRKAKIPLGPFLAIGYLVVGLAVAPVRL